MLSDMVCMRLQSRNCPKCVQGVAKEILMSDTGVGVPHMVRYHVTHTDVTEAASNVLV